MTTQEDLFNAAQTLFGSESQATAALQNPRSIDMTELCLIVDIANKAVTKKAVELREYQIRVSLWKGELIKFYRKD